MANFKGGFAFNNEAAKVEVEQAPDGTLISCVNPVTGQSMSSGNYSEVINGTADAPFGDYTVMDLAEELVGGNISIFARIDASALGIQDPIIGPIYSSLGTDMLIMDGASFISGPTLSRAYDAQWYSDGSSKLFMYNSGITTDATAYMSAITSTVTILHHPMS